MSVVFSIRYFIVSLTTICLVLIPRVLYYFGLRAEALDTILSAWATFIIFIFVGVLLTYPLLKNIKLAIFILLGIVAAAAILTFYFCDLALPW